MSLLSTDITQLKRLSLSGDNKPAPPSPPKDVAPKEPRPTPTQVKIDVPGLISLAHRLIRPESSYSKEEVLDRIIAQTQVDQDRAERGFNLMLEAKALEVTPAQTYYLAGSTPF